MICFFIESTNRKRTEKFTLLFLLYLLCCFVMLGNFLVLTDSYAEECPWYCPSLRKGDSVIVKNVNPDGLNLRWEPNGDKKPVKVFDEATGTILQGPKPFGSHIWYKVKWDIPVDGIEDGWSAGIIGQSKGCSVQTLRLHQEGNEAKSIRQREAQRKAEIAAKLFKLELPDDRTNHDYNDYGCEPRNYWHAYIGGHSGWDVQTKNVAKDATADEPFYSLTSGQVINVTKGNLNDTSIIAVYNSDDDMTTLYLHARKVFVKEDQEVDVGDRLGIQGNFGLWPLEPKDQPREYVNNKKSYQEHVHIEVREGKIEGRRETELIAPGAGESQKGPHRTIDPIPYLYDSISKFPENPTPGLAIGDSIFVQNTVGGGLNGLRVRSGAGTGFSQIGGVWDGATGTITDGPRAANGYTWWKVRWNASNKVRCDENPCEGWSVEFFNGIRLISKRGLAAPPLHVVIPTETILLSNYPNPFNPETWIPYQLSESADVSVSIYAVDGHLVRRLDLGHQSAGVYRSRSRAAYWDGRNALGEPVASGVYFYTLTAGEFTATRKMLIRK